MRYFVISDDGQKFGPADLGTLNVWIQEGRLLSDQSLEEEHSGVRVAAPSVEGLVWPETVAPPKAQEIRHGDQIWTFAGISLIFGIAGCIACPILPLVSLPSGFYTFKIGNRIEAAGGDAKKPKVAATAGIFFSLISILMTAFFLFAMTPMGSEWLGEAVKGIFEWGAKVTGASPE